MSANTPNFRTALAGLSKNNANGSSTFNGYIAILEGAEGTVAHRERINTHLISLIPEENKEAFNSLGTLREKVAFVAFLTEGNTNDIINKICEEILANIDLSESAVIRLSALNRFSINLTNDQNIALLKIENELSGIVSKRIPDLLPNLHIKNETVAQRIQKIKEITEYLIKNGILENYPEGYKSIIDLLNPLVELDNTYHVLNHARNNFYDIQSGHGEIQILSSSESKKLEASLSLIVGDGTTLDKFFQSNIQPNLEDINLESVLESILSKCSDAGEKLRTLRMSVGDFQKYFLYYFSTEILYKSKLNHDKKKKEVFKDRKRDFELDVKKWREIQRDRLVRICGNINNGHEVEYLPDDRGDQIVNVVLGENITEQDLQIAENIFERDRKLFLRTGNAENDNNLLGLLRLILERRYPNTDRNASSNLATAILDENRGTNELYYGNTNYFQNDSQDTGGQQLVKTIGNAGRSIQGVGKFTTPIIGGFVNLTKKSLELGGKTTAGIINGTTSSISGVVGRYNTWANTPAKGFIGSVVKFPFKASQILTRPLGWGASGVNFVAGKTTELVKGSYNGINESIKSASNNEIDSLFDVFTKTYKHGVNLLGNGVAWTGDKAFDYLKTEQKRQILSEFYESKSSSEVSALLEAIDMQSVLKDSSPYVFDDDYIESLGYDIKPEEEEVVETPIVNKTRNISVKINNIDQLLTNKFTKDDEVSRLIRKAFKKIDGIDNNIDDNLFYILLQKNIKKLIKKLRTVYESNKDNLNKLGFDGTNIVVPSFLGELHLFALNIDTYGNRKDGSLDFNTLFDNLEKILTK